MIPTYQRHGSLTSTAINRGQLSPSLASATLSPAVKAPPLKGANTFPDRPLISAQPLRYNVQLNQQLTAVQQADYFLQEMEKQVLQLSHAITRRGRQKDVVKQANSLQQWLSRRQQLSAGTIDSQLQINLQGKTQVSFNLLGGETLLMSAATEMLTFSLAGGRRDISAAMLDIDNSPQQNLLRLNQALGKWGIHGRLNTQLQLNFQVDEQRWDQVSQQLSVQGGGVRYPEGQFYPIKPQRESGLEEDLQQLLLTPSRAMACLGSLEKALDTVTNQRVNLQIVREQVQLRIESMVTFSNSLSACQMAEGLSRQLKKGDFATLSQALVGQANVQTARVRNVLVRG